MSILILDFDIPSYLYHETHQVKSRLRSHSALLVRSRDGHDKLQWAIRMPVLKYYFLTFSFATIRGDRRAEGVRGEGFVSKPLGIIVAQGEDFNNRINKYKLNLAIFSNANNPFTVYKAIIFIRLKVLSLNNNSVQYFTKAVY